MTSGATYSHSNPSRRLRNRSPDLHTYDPQFHHAGLNQNTAQANGFFSESQYGYANFRREYAQYKYPSFYSPCNERDFECMVDSEAW